ncbi:MAG TPA: M48 family metallopeptidase [Verrucomicrobiae bacterium]
MTRAANSGEASLFHPDFGGEPIGGRISVNQLRVVFHSEQFNLEIPVDCLNVEFEDGGEGFFFSDTQTPEIKIFTRDQSILQQPAIKALPEVAATVGRREFMRALRLTFYFLAACAVITWVGSLATGAMVRAISTRVPMDWEKKSGAEEIEKLQKQGILLDDSNSVAQLTSLAQPLVKVLPAERRDVKFYISNIADPNAFALPGGSIVVNKGLLQMMHKPEQLLGVLGHELAHQTKRHAIRKRISAAGPLVLFGVFLHSNSGAGNLLAIGSGLMVYQGFSQEYETEADETGWDYLVAANIDPRGMIEAFKKLKEAEEKPGAGSFGPQALQSHPATQKRIERLQEKWDKLARKSGFIELQPVQWSL